MCGSLSKACSSWNIRGGCTNMPPGSGCKWQAEWSALTYQKGSSLP